MSEREDFAAMFEKQQETIRELTEKLRLIAARMPAEPEPEPVPGQFYEWPTTVYRKQDEAVKGQVDHVGYDSMPVANQAQFEDAIADGWMSAEDWRKSVPVHVTHPAHPSHPAHHASAHGRRK